MPVDTSKVPSLRYELFKQRHPTYDADHWDELEALYRGGQHILCGEMLKRLMPRHRNELEQVYSERRARASYIPHAGEIIDHIVASLFTDPPTFTTEAEAGSSEERALDPYYDAFLDDCSPEGAKRCTFAQFLRHQILEALKKKIAWTLVDMPARDREYMSRADEDAAGVRNAYVVAIDRRSVVDFEEDEDGQLEWAMVMRDTSKRKRITSRRNIMRREFTYYTRDSWERYYVEWDTDEKREPEDNDMVKREGGGGHSFGGVPLIRLELPDGLWAMEKMHSLAIALFNQHNALDWATFQSLMPELYEFEGPEEPLDGVVSEAQQDEQRATNQPRGQGYVQVRGHQDRAEFVGPDTSPFDFALKSIMSKRDELHRVTHKMALTVDNSPSSLRRSGESKREDKADTEIVLCAFGEYVREHGEDVLRMIATGRGDAELADQWQGQGLEDYDAETVAQALENALVVSQVKIPSPTFHRRYAYKLAKLVGGESLTDEDLELVEAEIELNIVDEQFEPVLPMSPLDLADPRDEDDEDDDEGDEDDEGDDDDTPRTAGAGRGAASKNGAAGGTRTLRGRSGGGRR